MAGAARTRPNRRSPGTAAQPRQAAPLDVLRDWLKAGRAPQMRYLSDFEGEIVHFSPDAAAIARNGFLYGVRDLRILDNSMAYERSASPGFNFAFEALSDDAERFAYTSRGAVLLRVKGIRVEHMGDQEEQVVFWGPDAGEMLGVIAKADRDGPWTDGSSEGSYAECAAGILAGPAPRP